MPLVRNLSRLLQRSRQQPSWFLPPRLRTLRVQGTCRGSVPFLRSSNKRHEASRRCHYLFHLEELWLTDALVVSTTGLFISTCALQDLAVVFQAKNFNKLVGFESDGGNPRRGELRNSPGGNVRNQ